MNPEVLKKQKDFISCKNLVRNSRQPQPQLFSAVPKHISVCDRTQSGDPARDPSLAVLSGLIVAVTAASI